MSSTNLSPFSVFITNLGKYNEGELLGEWVNFPTTAEEIQEVFTRIKIGTKNELGVTYEEFIITDFDVNVGDFKIGELENLDELNYLAFKLDNLKDWEIKQFCAAVELKAYSSVADLINFIENLDSFYVLSDVNSDYDLGYYYIEDAGVYDLSDLGNLKYYIDYEKFGRDVRIEEGGKFTPWGYAYSDGGVCEYYEGIEDMDDDLRVLAFSEAVEDGE